MKRKENGSAVVWEICPDCVRNIVDSVGNGQSLIFMFRRDHTGPHLVHAVRITEAMIARVIYERRDA
jgi:hypothetical protein